jgi:hypothetical protein
MCFGLETERETNSTEKIYVLVATTGALPTIGPDPGRVFAIERNGEEICRHEVTVEQRGGRLEVRIKVTVDYRFCSFPCTDLNTTLMKFGKTAPCRNYVQ